MLRGCPETIKEFFSVTKIKENESLVAISIVIFKIFHIFIYFFFFFPFIFISWRLITLQYCSGFCHTLT